MAAAAFRMAFLQPTIELAREHYARAVGARYPAVVTCALDAGEDVLAYMGFPAARWRQMRSTHPVERWNQEIRCRTDVVGIFPNNAALLRLVTMVLVEQDDEWLVSRRSFSIGFVTKSMKQPDAASPEALSLQLAPG